MKVVFLPHPVVGSPWHDHIVNLLEARYDVHILDHDCDLPSQFEDVRAVVDLGGNAEAEVLAAMAEANVEFIQAQTNGLDHVPLDEIRRHGFTLAHCPGYLSATALAQTAMMYMLILAGRFQQAQITFREGPYYTPAGYELGGKILGIIGFGASGTELARRAQPFGMKIHAIDVRPIDKEILEEIHPEFLGGPDAMDQVIAESDFLSVHLHLTKKTRHIIDARRLDLMKPDACLINVTRGPLVDEEALFERLLSGAIGSAGLDAFDVEPPDPNHPVFALPNVAVTPHTGGGTEDVSRRRAQFALDNLDRFFAGEPLEAVVFTGSRS
ncbi:MAG: 2-hydroxyacid dehydrogenase [Candidatus Latescibacterota bacterium]|nr:2-hydroxyacid dehydrogenase [Candidatus Latescibacterota bacterium]